MSTNKKLSYNEMNVKLTELLHTLQDPETEVDLALENYQAGVRLIAEMEQYLKQAKLEIDKFKLDNLS